jgi:hypothetical protein
MKKLIIILLLSPLFSKAQVDFKTDTLPKFSTANLGDYYMGGNTYIGKTYSGTIKLLDKSKWVPYLVVKDENQKIICKVDTLGHLQVYGDTTTVLKALIRNFGIKVD